MVQRHSWLVVVLAYLACTLPAGAAPCSGVPADCVEVRFTVDGNERLYQYHVPQGASCPAFHQPVVLFLHGGGGNATHTRTSMGYASSDRNCYLLVFPQAVQFPSGGIWTPGNCIGLPPSSGYKGPTTDPGCGFGLENLGINDVHYIGALLDDLKARVSYDTRRVYASGFSHGGGMIHRLACELSERIAAIAPLEGTIKIPQCASTRGVPVMEWAALTDTTSPFAGGTSDASVPYTISVHLANLQLPPFTAPTQASVSPSPLTPAITDTIRTWQVGRDGSSVVLHTLAGALEHTWLFDNPVAFDWQEANWTFFKQYALPAQQTKHRSVRH
jgi:polyhydroxybutyrate depolymerase